MLKPLNLEKLAHRKTASFLDLHPSDQHLSSLDGLGSTNLQSYNEFKEIESFRRSQKAHVKHQQSIILWDEVIGRMKEKVRKHKVSLIERQVVNPDDFAK